MTQQQHVRPGLATVGVALAVVAAVGVPVAPAQAATSTLSQSSDGTYQTNGAVTDVLTIGTTTYLAGSFTSVRPAGAPAGSREVRRSRLAAVDSTTGQLKAWAPVANGTVESLAAGPDGTIYLGGAFSTVNGSTRQHVAAVTPAGVLTGFRADTAGNVKAVAAAGTTVYLGGAFTRVNGTARTRLAAVNASTGAVSSAWKPAANDTVLALALSPDGRSVYAGGLFGSVNGKTAQRRLVKTAAATGALQPWSQRPGYPVSSIVVTGTRVFIGGDGSGGHAGAYTTTGGLRWQLQTDGGVNAVAERGGVVYVGGHFDNVCNGDTAGATSGFRCPENKAARKKLLAVDAETAALDPWNPGANSTIGVTALETAPGRLRVGGLFTKLGRVPGGSGLRDQQGYGSFSSS